MSQQASQYNNTSNMTKDDFQNQYFTANFSSDISFASAFLIILIIFLYAGFKSLKKKENRNSYIIFTILFLVLTMAARLGTLIYQIIQDFRFKFSTNTYLYDFFIVELPFTLMINAQIVQWCQWFEVAWGINSFYKKFSNSESNPSQPDSKKIQKFMNILNLSSVVLLVLDFVACYIFSTPKANTQPEIVFYRTISYMLAVKYTIITFAFIPLFCFIGLRMKQTLPPEMFKQVRCKTFTLFVFYTILLLFRLAMYCFLRLQDSKTIYFIKTDQEIPLYISEIIMSILIIYMLFSSSFTNDEKNEEQNPNQRQDSILQEKDNEKLGEKLLLPNSSINADLSTELQTNFAFDDPNQYLQQNQQTEGGQRDDDNSDIESNHTIEDESDNEKEDDERNEVQDYYKFKNEKQPIINIKQDESIFQKQFQQFNEDD